MTEENLEATVQAAEVAEEVAGAAQEGAEAAEAASAQDMPEVVYNQTGGIVECPVPKSVRECAIIAAQAAHDKKAVDIVIQDVRELISVTDYFVIVTASNSRQVNAIVDNIEEEGRRKGGMKPTHREGGAGGAWTLLDYGEFVVHVFQPEARDYYRLEELWNDAPTLELDLD